MVSDVLWMLGEGANVKKIREAYPSLTKEHVQAALEFVAKLTENRFDGILASA
ncbi:MAG: DUF433 domain-containing protein [Candidatus Aenigmarchaeota archaeon]|nr:DUF433 domain-containing protein [Candidatus Aenigmarchaeota archaeon]